MRPRLIHRDLHDKQVLFDSATGDVGMLDPDTVSVGDPAVDIANVLVHLELRRAQGVLSCDRAEIVRRAFLRGLSVDDRADGALGERIAAYTVATRLRLHAVYAFRWQRFGNLTAPERPLTPAAGPRPAP